MRRAIFGPLATVAAVLLTLLAAPAAQATFHLIQVREVYLGSALEPEAEYVELQMYAGGQDHVKGHKVRSYDASGAVIGTSTFLADVPNGANQSTIVLATSAAASEFGFTPDMSLASPGALSPAGGAVCWEELDCVSWGGFSGSLPSPSGAPASAGGIPDGMALRRTIARGCPTALDPPDDSDSSAADFSLAAPQPRPNSVPPSEQLCLSSGGGGSGGGSPGSANAPQTILRRKPPKHTSDRTPTFRFGADEAGIGFECKLDGKRFRKCRSPFTAKPLSFGPHRFQVRARDNEGKVDPTPASYRFRVVRHALFESVERAPQYHCDIEKAAPEEAASQTHQSRCLLCVSGHVLRARGCNFVRSCQGRFFRAETACRLSSQHDKPMNDRSRRYRRWCDDADDVV